MRLSKRMIGLFFAFFLSFGRALGQMKCPTWFWEILGFRKKKFNFSKKGLHPNFFLILCPALFTKEKDQVRTNLATRR